MVIYGKKTDTLLLGLLFIPEEKGRDTIGRCVRESINAVVRSWRSVVFFGESVQSTINVCTN